MARGKPRSATYHHTEVAVGRRRRARHRLVHRIRQRQVNELVVPAERALNAPVTVELHCRADRAERHNTTATTESTAKSQMCEQDGANAERQREIGTTDQTPAKQQTERQL